MLGQLPPAEGSTDKISPNVVPDRSARLPRQNIDVADSVFLDSNLLVLLCGTDKLAEGEGT